MIPLSLFVCVCECTFLEGRGPIASIRLVKVSGTQNRLIISVLISEVSLVLKCNKGINVIMILDTK